MLTESQNETGYRKHTLVVYSGHIRVCTCVELHPGAAPNVESHVSSKIETNRVADPLVFSLSRSYAVNTVVLVTFMQWVRTWPATRGLHGAWMGLLLLQTIR